MPTSCGSEVLPLHAARGHAQAVPRTAGDHQCRVRTLHHPGRGVHIHRQDRDNGQNTAQGAWGTDAVLAAHHCLRHLNHFQATYKRKNMEELITFEVLAGMDNVEVTQFQPDYTDAFSDYMRKSIQESEQMSREAMNSAASVIIYR